MTPMELRKFLRILYSQRKMISLMCLSAVITATMLTYVMSERYRSRAIVLIRPQQSVNMVPTKDEMLNFPVSFLTPVDTTSKTYTEIIKSRTIAERVVGSIGIGAFSAGPGNGWVRYWREAKSAVKDFFKKAWVLLKYGRIEKQDPFSLAVQEVQGGLVVKPSKGTYLFDVQAEAGSPQLAAAIANVSAKEFVSYLKELRTSELKKARAASEDSIELYKKQLEHSKSAVVKYEKLHKVVSPDQELTLGLQSLSKLEDSQEELAAKIKGLTSRQNAILQQLAQYSKFTPSATTVSANPLYSELKSKLSNKEIELAGLLKKFTDQAMNVQMVRAEIREIKTRMSEVPPTLKSAQTTSRDPVYQSLQGDLVKVRTDLKSLEAESAKVSAAIAEKQKMIARIPEKESQLSQLKLLANLNEETYRFMSKDHDEAVAESQKEDSDIAVVQSAAPPTYPAAPIKIYYAALAAALSLISGVGVALAMEGMNTRIRYVDEVEQGFNLPVLMAVPQVNSDRQAAWPLIAAPGKAIADEKRRHERVGIQLPVELTNAGGETVGRGETIDVSRGGVFCELHGQPPLAVNDRIKINGLSRSGAEKTGNVEGVIVRAGQRNDGNDTSKIAIKFLDMHEAAAGNIQEIIQARKSILLSDLPGYFEEHIRGIRSDLQFLNSGAMSSFLITSCSPGEGKSTIAANLAVSLAEINKKVVVVDANMRSPSLHAIFGVSNKAGLADILSARGELKLEDLERYLKFHPGGACILPSGRPACTPPSLLVPERLVQIVVLLAKSFDFVLFDSPHLFAGPDAALIASVVQGTIITAKSGSTLIADGKRAKQLLDRANAKALGVIVNSFTDGDAHYYRA